MAKRILITGGCGFIGTNAAAALFGGNGWEVDSIDNLSRRGSEANQEFLAATAAGKAHRKKTRYRRGGRCA
jgi:nucleoside-diphosphate-sugar epimerase